MIYTVFFLIFAAIIVIASAKAVTDRNIVHSAVWLMFFMIAVASLFFFLGASFIGAVELLVYVGAIVSMLVFSLMITGGEDA